MAGDVKEHRSSQMRVIGPGVAEGSVVGLKFWATPTRARKLLAAGTVELVNAADAPPDTGILRRSKDWPLDRFSHVAPGWAERVAVLVGGGPSLTLADVALAAAARAAWAVRIIAVNDSYLWLPAADILYAADAHWWAWHRAGTAKPVLGLTAAQVRDKFLAFPGERCTIQNSGLNVEDSTVHMLRNFSGPGRHSTGLSLDPGALVTGSNSGFQALNLAVLAGARTVLLLGFDGRSGRDGRTHWSGGHPRATLAGAWESYRRAMTAAAPALKAAGVRVINCSPGSAIETFDKMPLAQALR